MSDPDEMVHVEITASQRVRYRQFVKMKRSEWEELKRMPDAEVEDADGPLCVWLDLADVQGGGDFDAVDMCVVDAEGKPVQPTDEYEG